MSSPELVTVTIDERTVQVAKGTGMVETAAALGYEYVAITDHSPSSAATRNLSAKAVARQADEIARLRERCLGRPVTEEEVQEYVRPFLRQHVVLRVLHKLGMTA